MRLRCADCGQIEHEPFDVGDDCICGGRFETIHLNGILDPNIEYPDTGDAGDDSGTVSNAEMRAFNSSRTGFIGTRSEEGDGDA